MLAAARISAAIEVLDRMLSGTPLEPALTNWGRANRFAGSGDRAAIRDLVFDAWRCKRSYAALGGAETGRGLHLIQSHSEVQTLHLHPPRALGVAINGQVGDDAEWPRTGWQAGFFSRSRPGQISRRRQEVELVDESAGVLLGDDDRPPAEARPQTSPAARQ